MRIPFRTQRKQKTQTFKFWRILPPCSVRSFLQKFHRNPMQSNSFHWFDPCKSYPDQVASCKICFVCCIVAFWLGCPQPSSLLNTWFRTRRLYKATVLFGLEQTFLDKEQIVSGANQFYFYESASEYIRIYIIHLNTCTHTVITM